jgi:hypothetical protein
VWADELAWKCFEELGSGFFAIVVMLAVSLASLQLRFCMPGAGRIWSASRFQGCQVLEVLESASYDPVSQIPFFGLVVQ